MYGDIWGSIDLVAFSVIFGWFSSIVWSLISSNTLVKFESVLSSYRCCQAGRKGPWTSQWNFVWVAHLKEMFMTPHIVVFSYKLCEQSFLSQNANLKIVHLKIPVTTILSDSIYMYHEPWGNCPSVANFVDLEDWPQAEAVVWQPNNNIIHMNGMDGQFIFS